MYILLILLAFILLAFSFYGLEIKSYKNGFLFDVRLAVIKAFIGIAFFSYLTCEILSIFNVFSFNYVLISWLLINGIIIYLNKEKIKLNLFSVFSQKITISKQEINILYFIFFLIILPLLLLAIFIPPNNWDSMAYHLPRVEHWIQNQNVYSYPTNIVRQVLTSPLSEYMIANFQILSSTDAFSNLVQFASFIFILCSATLIFSILKINYKGQLFLLLALLSLPMILFQATTTQTDLLASFFFLSFILFGLLLIQSDDNFKTNFIFLALSLMLGILTKYHIAIFAAPIVIYLLFDLIKKKNNKNTIFVVLISILTIAVILGPLFLRNIFFFGSISGKELFDDNATIVNSTISIQNMLSNNFKHIVDFISLPIKGYNNLLFSANHSLHNIIGISENTPGNNWAGESFTVNNHLNEDTAGSIIHAALIILSLFLVFKSKQKTKLLLLFAYCFIAFSLYGLLFRYTPFDIRLLLPVLLFMIIISTYIIYNTITNKHIINGLILLFLIISIFPVYFNRAKPIIGNPFYLRRVLTNSPKGDLDKASLTLLPNQYKEAILNNYILVNAAYTLKKDLSKEQRKILFKLEDAIGLFDFDKKIIFQKSRLDNYFTQNPSIQKNMDTLSSKITQTNEPKNSITGKPIYIDLKTEFDSYEYLIWVYAKANFKNGFYIGNSDSLKFRSYSKNTIDPKLYNIEVSDKNKNWSIKYKN
jgi:hypothetical protein